MVAPRPTDRTVVPPPELPSLPDSVPTQLVQYLRTFALWCRNGFADKVSATSGQPGIMIRATNAATGAETNFIYLVGVRVTVTGNVPSAPTITFTAVPLGSGLP